MIVVAVVFRLGLGCRCWEPRDGCLVSSGLVLFRRFPWGWMFALELGREVVMLLPLVGDFAGWERCSI